MKTIKLIGGYEALVDDEDFDFLNQWKWRVNHRSSTSYAIRGHDKKGIIRMHRVLLGLQNDDALVPDHINGNGLDNQKHNLRLCTKQQNALNRRKALNKTSSQYKGVSLVTYKKTTGSNKRMVDYKYWISRIMINGKRKTIKTFPYTSDGEKLAAIAYNEAAKKYHGEFANLNKI